MRQCSDGQGLPSHTAGPSTPLVRELPSNRTNKQSVEARQAHALAGTDAGLDVVEAHLDCVLRAQRGTHNANEQQ